MIILNNSILKDQVQNLQEELLSVRNENYDIIKKKDEIYNPITKQCYPESDIYLEECKNGELYNNKCICREGYILQNNNECVDGKDKCIGGKIIEAQCYCPPKTTLINNECVIPNGKCNCGMKHMCNEDCNYKEKTKGCSGKCNLIYGHDENEIHNCGKKHYCIKDCDYRKIARNCKGEKCILEFDHKFKKRRIVPFTQDDIAEFAKFRNPFNHMTVIFKKNNWILFIIFGNILLLLNPCTPAVLIIFVLDIFLV